MKKTILILGIIAVFFASCKRDEMLEEGDKWHSGHAAVDLGLPSGLYWATCNIGASSPEEDGYFFAWGEVYPKTVSSEENSETNNKNLGDISGDAQYDAARANWGGYWRMPTKYEMQELVEHCSWEKETQNGIEGYRVTGPSGNSVFMAGSHWTSSPYKDAVYISHPPIYNHNEAYMLDVNGDVFSAHRINLNNVRPVFCKSESPQGFDAISESVNVTSTTANFHAMVMQDEPSIIKTYGVCWSTNARPTIDDDCDTRYEYLDPMNHGNCSYDTHLENLQPNTKYYVRAFATHGDAVVYGEIMSFTTLPAESGQENGLTYIDLGLPSGVKWSMEIFDNTSWGEDGRWKDTYEAGNCITYGMQLGDISGNDDYDLVQRSWGGAWRMPTEYEMRELVEQCSWEWGYHENYGSTLYGYKVTGPNGNSIVIPANGYRGESAYTYEGFEKKGYYWTSTPYNDGSNHYAYSLEFDEGNIEVKQNLRYYGYNIIPVIGFNSQIYPTVVTNEVTDITCNSAKCEVEIISEGSIDILHAVGAYWGKNPNPNVDDFDGADFDGTASRVVEMSYLEPNTTYYVRAAAHTSLGIIYGEERSFTTLEDVKELPVVTTNEITDVEAGSAICVSEVTDDGGGTVSARGVCWSTKQNPTIEDNKTNDGSGTGSYTSKLSNLASQTTYYVRAYATNETGTAYGKEVSFTTLEMTLPVVTTKMASDITCNSALCGGEILSTGGSNIEISGLLWANYPNLTLDSNPLTYDNSGYNIVGSWNKEITHLWHNTTYYVRAYATNEMGTSYGEEISFTTLGADTFEETISGDENGYSYVDLGLPSGLKWATCNVKASNYKEQGYPYAWGETTIKSEYTISNSVTYGKNISEFSGNAQYDAATANWGGEWRMPTKAEFEELLDECTWEWLTLETDDGYYSNGYEVTGPNGNRIFLPETCIYENSGFARAGGHYWSSSPHETNNEQAYYLYLSFGDNTATVYCSSGTLRHEGMSIRPVFGGNFTGPEEQPEEPETPSANQSFTVNGVTFTMIAVEGGTFQMGATSEQGSDAESDESPVHDVTLSSYYIGETEVTQELWEAVMGSNPSNFSGSQRPVERVSWNDCQEFITKLNNLTGKNFRLPTEAEWEDAARGGNKSQGYKYSGSNTIDNVAWYTSNSSSQTHDVKTKQANELGIYDMSGNVWEWCLDWYGSYSSGSQTNPTGPSSGSNRVSRGGCWGNFAGVCRVSNRGYDDPDIYGYNLGLRLCLSQY